MTLSPKDVAALAILAQSPHRYDVAIKVITGKHAKQIAKCISYPNCDAPKGYHSVAKDIVGWVEKCRNFSLTLNE